MSIGGKTPENIFNSKIAQHENYANSAFSFSQFATFSDEFLDCRIHVETFATKFVQQFE